MKGSIILILVLFLLSGCTVPEEGKEPTFDELKRVDVTGVDSESELIFGEEQELNEFKKIFGDIEWVGDSIEMSKEPDVSAHIFFTVEEGNPELVRPYEIWFNSDQTATLIDPHDRQMGELKEERAMELQELINDKKDAD